MMNPQYLPPGQNNNTPSNPIGYPPSTQEFNGVHNANVYSQVPPNGQHMPPKSFDQNDMSQKMQSMNLSGPGIPNITASQLPPDQLPPGSNFPPTSNFGSSNVSLGQRPQSQLPPGRPPVSGVPQQMPIQQKPPSSMPGPLPTQGFGQIPPPSQTPNQFQGPPTSMSKGPPLGQTNNQMPGQSPMQMPPHSQSLPLGPMGKQPSVPPGHMKQSFQQPGIPSQPQVAQQTGLPPQIGMTPQPSQGPPGPLPSHPGQMPPPKSESGPGQPNFSTHSGQPSSPPQSQLGMPPSTLPQQPSVFSQPGLQQQIGIKQQPGLPLQPAMQQHPGLQPQTGIAQQPGLPPQPGLQSQTGMTQQPGLPQHSGLQPQTGLAQHGLPLQHGMPPQPGIPQQPGLPPQPGMPPQSNLSQHQGMSQQPGLPPQSGLQPGMSHHQSLPPQPGMPQQPGFPTQQPGMTPQHNFPPQSGLPPQPGMPPQPFQQSLPPQQMTNQYPSMPGLPHMPPQRQQYPGMPSQQYQQGYQQPQSGYPPQQPPFPGQQPSYPGQQYQQPPQKRLDPDSMPSPIQVMADDQQNRGGIFVTNEKGLVPPLVTTDFIVDDKGNASPRYIRSSMYSVPVTADLLKQTSMPFCLVVSPMAEPVGSELEPPLLDFAALTNSPSMGPVRCSRCKAYMCPNMKFIDAGRHFKCAFCKATTEVPMEYTQYINSMQQYGRVPAEMALGAYEIVATKEYCRNNTLPNPPAVVFVIDVSYNSIKNGMLNTICQNIHSFIDALPKDPQTGQTWTRVGFITYSSTVHFYNIKGTLGQPQMLSVGDVGDMFVPLLEGFLVRAEDSGSVLDQLLQLLPSLFKDNKETETILLPAVQAGLEALKAADTSGQLLVFHTSLPTYNAPGKLNNREDRKLLATDKEKQILGPQTTAYNELGQACSAAGVCVELFVCNNAYVDAATVGQLPRLTGGHLHKYTYFTAETDGARLAWQVRRTLARRSAHDAVMRVRASTGVRATDFYGHFFMSNTTDIELAAIDADKAVGIEIKHDDKLTGEDGVYIQAALLYTHRSGQRRLRILNLALNVAHQLADAYRSMELDTCINFLTKQAVWSLRESGGRAVREALSARCARSLAAYRRHCASPSAAGQLVLPESMKLLPLYTCCLLRSDALASGTDVTCDDRSCAMYRALSATVELSVAYTYPRLLPLHELPQTPRQLRASADKMQDTGVYLLENGVHMLMWVGAQAPPEFVRDVFGVAAAQQVDTQVAELPALDNETSVAVRELLQDARVRRRSAMRLTIMRQHDKLETVLRHFLVEDRGVDGSASYVDYLCHVHKEIRALL